MLTLDDLRKRQLLGGYRIPCDVIAILSGVLDRPYDRAAWDALWQELYHQGDIGEASLSVIPFLVRSLVEVSYDGPDLWAYIGSIQIAKGQRENPNVPEWLLEDYLTAMELLLKYSYMRIPVTTSPETMRYIFGFILWMKNDKTFGQALIELTPDVIEEALESYGVLCS
ncbi:hypothetical protein Q4Q49_21670 [Shewanella sp. SP1S1-7]|uniref:Uncharacterized protein n=1 Tax=Shewanella scandinavica TaxID=3063538 RepID=A0ABU3G5U4_9GAMM|nr:MULTISPECIES: hypothetical protein [unclassified Shewanella]MDT3282997.1 hypothetical protein [Shewanella sp. SP2S1-2]MDT3337880.1 hypothetical protein [Shewanella sp. SP1S1-7]